MTLREFKAWLEGYEESFGYSGPSTAQWAKVKERLALIEHIYHSGGFVGPKYNFLVGSGTAVSPPEVSTS